MKHFIYFILLIFNCCEYSEASEDSIAVQQDKIYLDDDVLKIKESNYPILEDKIYINPYQSKVRQQDDAGLCYAIAASTLIENFRCKKLKLDCSRSSEHVSPLDLGSYLINDRKDKIISSAGDIFEVLNSFKESTNKIVKDDCAPYDSLNFNYSNKSIPPLWSISPSSANITTKDNGVLFIQSLYAYVKEKEKFEKDNFRVTEKCLANYLKLNMPKLATDIEEILIALNTSSDSENFMYKTLIPQKCYEPNNMIHLPNYKINSYPTEASEQLDKINLKSKVVELLKKEIPISMSGDAHVFILEGYKKKCNANECREFVRLKNSYGQKWQEEHNDGWVDLDTVINHAENFQNKNVIVWLEDN